MSEDVDEIRRRKARELLKALDTGTAVEGDVGDMLPWSYRFTVAGDDGQGGEIGVFQILQQGQVIAMTQDQRFAEMVTDYLNRMILIMDSGILGVEDEDA
tara:strand:- start:4387 stop:4686 length:300 start_codon:yes stop_codon:yes gene_type:complete